MKALLLRLEGPLVSFGGASVDNLGVVDSLPSVSLITGLLGNALGYQRTDYAKLQRLQERMTISIRLDRRGQDMTEFQTADLGAADAGWTTSGVPESRSGGAGTYAGKHLRYRDFMMDSATTIAVSLNFEDEFPTLQDLEAALMYPARPLFIGRKSCLPSGRVCMGIIDCESILEAARIPERAHESDDSVPIFVEAKMGGPKMVSISGLRNWRSGVHEGTQYFERLDEIGDGGHV